MTNIEKFLEWLSKVENAVLPTEEDIDYFLKKYGHEPFLHLIRQAVKTSEIEIIKQNFVPEKKYLPYLFADLKSIKVYFEGIIDAFKNDEELAEKIRLRDYDESINISGRCRVIADILLTPHGALKKKYSEEFAEYLESLQKVYEIADIIIFDLGQLQAVEDAKVVIESLKNIGIDLNAIGLEEKMMKFATYLNTTDTDVANIVLYSGEAVANAFESAGQAVNDAVEATGKTVSDIAKATGNFFSNFYDKLIILGIGIAGIYFGFQYLKSRPIRNPPLLLINPPNTEEYAILLKRAKAIDTDIKESEFKDALHTFFSQHGRYPDANEILDVKGPPGINFGILVGKVDEVTYEPPKGKKSPHRYRHGMKETFLASDPSGEHLFFVGRTYLDKNDGWLKK